jgi:hypothetical protein
VAGASDEGCVLQRCGSRHRSPCRCPCHRSSRCAPRCQSKDDVGTFG